MNEEQNDITGRLCVLKIVALVVVAAFSGVVVVVLLIGGQIPRPLPDRRAHRSADLTIVHFNDLDRMYEYNGRGGVARLATVIKSERERNNNVLVTFAGDAISPSLISQSDKGAHMIDLLNQLGLTAMAIGNHEYDFGPKVATERFKEAAFPVLGANNINDNDIIAGASASILVDMGGFKVGIFGLTTGDTEDKSSAGKVRFLPVMEVARKQSMELRNDGADLVIALSHTNLAEDRDLLDQNYVDMVLSGDDHVLQVDCNGGRLFVESGAQAKWVTVIDVYKGSERSTWSASVRIIDTADVDPDAELDKKVREIIAMKYPNFFYEIVTISTKLDSRNEIVRNEEAAIGNLITDAIREANSADIALINGGSIRGDEIYQTGTTLTQGHILTELPFGNPTVVLEVTGHEIVKALENGLSMIGEGAGRFPHISGLKVLYNPNGGVGERVTQVIYNRNPLDCNAKFTLATSKYVAEGNEGYDMFANKAVLNESESHVASQVIDYIARNGSVKYQKEGRVAVDDAGSRDMISNCG